MKSVGEVMAIGRTFEESLQKGLRMIGQGMHGFVDNKPLKVDDIKDALVHATDTRIFVIAKAMQKGYSIQQIHQLTKIDCWFLQKLQHVLNLQQQLRHWAQWSEFSLYNELRKQMEPTELMECIETPEFLTLLHEAKRYGFSDFQVARAIGLEGGMNMEEAGLLVREWRKEWGIVPMVNRIDTLAAEYPAMTNYLYMTYA